MKTIFYFFLLLAFAPGVYGQSGFYNLPPGKMAIGIGYQRYRPPTRTEAPFRFHAQTILGGLDYVFSPNLRVSLSPGVSFFDVTTKNPYEIAPSPSVNIQLLNINDMNMTGLKFFLAGGGRTQYINIVRTGSLPLHSVNMALRGGGGFLHILETNHNWRLKPYFSMFYTQTWNNVSTTEKVHVNTSENFFTAEAGVEVEMSPTMSAIGSIEFSFQSSELLYRFGINFYQAPSINRPTQLALPVISRVSRIDTDAPEMVSSVTDLDYEAHIEVAGPQYKSKVDPEYPETAINAGEGGIVVLEAIINEQGIPIDIVARTDLGYGLETAAIEALKRTTFYPAIWRGEPLARRVSIRYTFSIQEFRR